MGLHETTFRKKTIIIAACCFAAVWIVALLLGLLADTSNSLQPALLLAITFAITLFLLWRVLGPIDADIAATRAALKEKIATQSQTTETSHINVQRAKDSIEEANKSRHAFLSTMSYELRVPLNTIIGYSDLLYHKLHEENVRHKGKLYAFDINKAAMHLLTLVNDILDISNLGTGTSDLRIEKVSVYKLMEACHQLTEIRGTKPGLAIMYHLPKHDIPFCCDPARMKQVLLNLITNAITFTDPPGVVTVSIEETEDDFIQFTVADEGMGIPVDEIENVLKRFGRVDSQDYNVRNQQSTGLGLTLVQELVRMHDGHFNLHSVEDEGTVITVKIPNDLMANTGTVTQLHATG